MPTLNAWPVDLAASLCIVFAWPHLKNHWRQVILHFLACFLIGFSIWTYHYVGMSNINQLASTLTFGFTGLLSANKYFTLSVARFLLLYPLCAAVLLSLFGKKKIAPMFAIAGLFALSIQYDLKGFIQSYHTSKEDYFAHHFINPASIEFTPPSPKKSLVLIYVESLESSYQNTQLFHRNLLAPLSALEQPHLSFQKFGQSAGADWTMGGIVSSQCGIPLKVITLFNRNDIGSNIANYLPGAVCLSDVLNHLGYHNVFLKGGSLNFSGTGTFLKTHHYHEAFGKHEWLKQGFSAQQMNAWGLPDDLLFQAAKQKLAQLISQQHPFNLTLLTVDTHGTDGMLNQTCARHGGKSFEDMIACSAAQVADFIQYIDKQGWSKTLTIVVMGDHIAMKNKVFDKLTRGHPRYIFNLILTEDQLIKNRESVLHVDLFPTILSALGITWSPDGKLALGYSALIPLKQNLSADEHLATIEKITNTDSPQYNALWKQSP